MNNLKHKITPETHSLATTLSDLFLRNKAGHTHTASYDDHIGAELWESFVKSYDPKVQYNIVSEASSIEAGLEDITNIISNDKDLDIDNLIVIEKGNGSKEAMAVKSFKIIDHLLEKGIKVGLYSPWDLSPEYRQGAIEFLENYDTEVNPQDVDFTKDDPGIAVSNFKDVEKPRVVMEMGSSRGNIATDLTNSKTFAEQTYEELQRRFKQDRINCRDSGILILGADGNNTESAREAYLHPTHIEFSERIIYKAIEEGVIKNLDIDAFKYKPVWDEEDHVVKHALVFKKDQSFEILNEYNEFYTITVKAGEAFMMDHSIKWPADKIISAAESQGFKCLNIYRGEDERIPVYIFKAVPLKTELKLVK